MRKPLSNQLHHERISRLYSLVDKDLLKQLTEIIAPNAAEIANTFYKTMLSHSETHAFLNHSMVNDRLRHTMADWVVDILQPREEEEFEAHIKRQYFIGNVHARINIPMGLVNYGFSVLKTEMKNLIMDSQLKPELIPKALDLMHMMVDQAGYYINESYIGDLIINQRNEQALRLHVLNKDVALECERIRASLFDWLRNTLTHFHQKSNEGKYTYSPLMHSEVGLWVTHKAEMMFPDLQDISKLENLLSELDSLADNALKNRDNPRNDDFFYEINQKTSDAAWLLANLSEHSQKHENGRDPLTRVLNRRYLPVIMQRETEISVRDSSPYSALMIDIDHFKQINDTHGHAAGDSILQQFCELLMNNVRTSDFVFRMGGEEFLVVLVNSELATATGIADKILATIAACDFILPNGESMRISASIGLSSHDGHPDYSHILTRADKALFQAKSAGRNQIVIAEI